MCNDVEQQKPKVFISQLLFNNDQSVEIKKNDIVVFVGPNNAGKSRSLRDIWELGERAAAGIVVKSILIQKGDLSNIKGFLRTFSHARDDDRHTFFTGFGFSFYEDVFRNINSGHLGSCRNAFVSYLQTDNRLSVCNPPEIFDRNGIPSHPIHQIVKYPHYRETVTEYFNKAFGIPLIPNTQHGRTVPLCLGNIPQKQDVQGNNAQEMAEWYAQYLEQYPVLHEQGDGMRSFAGILLYLSMDYYRTFLIDEPESFLHPPQAKIMGHVITKLLKDDQQAFISTHSQHFIKGLLEEASNRVKIIRITRDGNNNTFSVLDNKKIGELLNDPLLKHSEILDGMFYKNVVICESDADCRFYSIINDYLKQQTGSFSETLFVHSGGKSRMGKIVQALKALNIDFRVVPDIDILNQESVISALVETCGGSWDTFQTNYNVLLSGLESVKNLTGDELVESIRADLSSYHDIPLSRQKMDDLKRFLEFKTKWDDIKKMGIYGAPRGDATRAINDIVKHLKEISIYVVPIGELECFVKEVGDHGPGWLNKVLEKYPDLNHEVFNEAKRFVSSWGI